MNPKRYNAYCNKLTNRLVNRRITKVISEEEKKGFEMAVTLGYVAITPAVAAAALALSHGAEGAAAGGFFGLLFSAASAHVGTASELAERILLARGKDVEAHPFFHDRLNEISKRSPRLARVIDQWREQNDKKTLTHNHYKMAFEARQKLIKAKNKRVKWQKEQDYFERLRKMKKEQGREEAAIHMPRFMAP